MTPEAVWSSKALWARGARAILAPFSLIFAAITTVRNWLYDTRLRRVVPSPIPVISVGNLSVGGTGKTPVTAYLVHRLLALGHRPAIVMRGYGKDETEVHALLNPGVRVYADPNRAAGIARAAHDGADTVVLDDAFQHRRAARSLDIVLISAEQWPSSRRTLPAGALREPLRGVRRADLICVTSRVAKPDCIQQVIQSLSDVAPAVPVALLHLRIAALHSVAENGPTVELERLAGAQVLAIAGIGDARSFFGQLEEYGAIVERRRFADHHAYTPADVASILASSESHKYIVTTLKDAVKLGVLWPAKAPPLWYVSQAVEVTGGLSAIDSALTIFLSKIRLEHPPAEIE